MYFVILPIHLFDIKYIPKNYTIVIYEHPHYFIGFKYNKKKIILHRGSMRYYYNYIKKYRQVRYVNFDEDFDIKEYTLFDPIDRIELSGVYTIIDSPNFLLTNEQNKQYRQKTDKFFFNAFYMWSKKILNILPDIKSQDIHNRSPLPSNVITKQNIPSNKSDSKYITEGIKYVTTHDVFKDNYGNCDNFIWPLTHQTAKKWLNHFITYKVNNFGTYQDSISKDNNVLFHSLLSTSINIGLLQPIEVINKLLQYNIELNNLEGFIRQLFWREYQRYCYTYCSFDKNYFGNNKAITKEWYNASTGINPVDTCIINAFNFGYLHHIERLMIIGNYMNLSGIEPDHGFKWFMEFSCDSYMWVMYQNVYDMVFFVTGGLTMRRPYVSSSNYVIKMSDYKRGDWSIKWDKLYHSFVSKHKNKLLKFRYYFAHLKM